MGFFKRLFSGGGTSQSEPGDAAGIYFYVRPNGCDEVVRVRINKNNDPSLNDDGSYFVVKSVRGSSYKCRPAELQVTFDKQRNVKTKEVTGGELVTQADYEAWVAAQNGAS